MSNCRCNAKGCGKSFSSSDHLHKHMSLSTLATCHEELHKMLRGELLGPAQSQPAVLSSKRTNPLTKLNTTVLQVENSTDAMELDQVLVPLGDLMHAEPSASQLSGATHDHSEPEPAVVDKLGDDDKGRPRAGRIYSFVPLLNSEASGNIDISWFPFKDEFEFNLTRWFMSTTVSQVDIQAFLDIPEVCICSV